MSVLGGLNSAWYSFSGQGSAGHSLQEKKHTKQNWCVAGIQYRIHSVAVQEHNINQYPQPGPLLGALPHKCDSSRSTSVIQAVL